MTVKPKLLLINPWAYDFSALNLWSRPLGLLKVAEHLSQYNVDLEFIDCTDEYKTKKKYGTGKYPREVIDKPEVLKSVPRNYARYGISIDDFTERIKQCLPCDLVLVTSIMTYWYPGVQKAIEIVKSETSSTPVILGGIYPSFYPEHAAANSGADYIFRGSIKDCQKNGPDNSLESIIESTGIKLTAKDNPKPYFNRSYPFAPLLTSSGCPFRCSYCASSVLANEFIQIDPLHISNEIRELYKTGVRDFAFYDDALLVNADSHIKLILRNVIASGLKIRFHCPNGIHARYINDEMAYLMNQSGFTTLRISLETVNRERQAKSGGKITSEAFSSAIMHLKNHGFKKENIGVYLMYGLPGQGIEEVREGIDFLKALNVKINLTEFSPIPGTSCWNELINKGIINDRIDPLLTNNSVFSLLYSGYGIKAIDELKAGVKSYNNI